MDKKSRFYRKMKADRLKQAYEHKAFLKHLRYGIPMAYALKQETADNHSTARYIWKTQGDSKVRDSHRKNHNKIFSWDDPPETGHPGEDYGCRCVAVPYHEKVRERMEMTMSGISDASPAWKDGRNWKTGEIGDFAWHYFTGNGRTIRLRDTGHLQAVVKEYWRQVEQDLLGQIADAARKNIDDNFTYDFYDTYEMGHIVFDLGETTIGGVARGRSQLGADGALNLSGHVEFYHRDEFRDPLNIGIEIPLGTVYAMRDEWQGQFRGIVNIDHEMSDYTYE